MKNISTQVLKTKYTLNLGHLLWVILILNATFQTNYYQNLQNKQYYCGLLEEKRDNIFIP